MTQKYTQQNIDQFFSRFKELPISYSIEKVHQLINDPNAKATHSSKQFFKPYKLFMMTSALIVGLSALWFWPTTDEPATIVVKKEIPHIAIGESTREPSQPLKVPQPILVPEVPKTKPQQLIASGDTSPRQTLEPMQRIEPDSALLEHKVSDIKPVMPIKPELNEKNYNIEVPVIHLTEDEMSKLGFEIYDDSVKFIFKDGCNRYTCKYLKPKTFNLILDSAKVIKEGYLTARSLAFQKAKGRVSMTFSSIQTSSVQCGKISFKDATAILLRAYTDDVHSEFKENIWVYDEDMKDGRYPSLNANDIDWDVLVPIKCTPNNSKTELPFFSQVFWIHPNEYLFNCLPDRISEELRLEYNAILKGATSPQSNCTYFEACKSTLAVDDMKIYPNPANQSITIDFSLPNESTGYISLVNISGAQIKVLVSDTNFQEGANHFTANVSDINPGIYMVMIKTDTGFKTQRLIITR